MYNYDIIHNFTGDNLEVLFSFIDVGVGGCVNVTLALSNALDMR